MKKRMQQTIGVIKSLYRTTKQRLLLFVSGQFRETEKTTKIDYNFNMKEYFTMEKRIEENRQRLRELFDYYKRIENYYPIFIAYLTVIGVYYFDFITSIIADKDSNLLTTITVLCGISILYVLKLIWNVFKGKTWAHDILPKGIYEDYDSDVIEKFPHIQKDSSEFNSEILKMYCDKLEEYVEMNNNTYKAKRDALNCVWKPMIFSLILFSLNIITYKTIIMKKSMLTEKPKDEFVVEIKTNDSTSRILLLTETQKNKLKKIIKENKSLKSDSVEGTKLFNKLCGR